jgi:Double zinc ribbon
MMTACPSCGTPARADDRFCAGCGISLTANPAPPPGPARFCTSCGGELEPDGAFCGRCGAAAPDGRIGTSAPVLEDQGDLLADWGLEDPDGEPPPRNQAVTEQVPLPPRASDTAVIEGIPPEGPPVPSRPALRPAGEARPPSRGFPVGATFALLGAVAVIVSSILDWGGPFRENLPRDIPFRLLLDPGGSATGPSLGVVLLGVGTAGALMALLTMAVPGLKPLRRLIGLVALIIAVGFALRTLELGGVGLFGLPTALGPGVYTALAGGFVQLLAGRWFRT